jgi:hypothetical protein
MEQRPNLSILARMTRIKSPHTIHEAPLREMSEMSKIVLEASRTATENMLDYYKRMGIKVTLAPEKPKCRASSSHTVNSVSD